MKSPMPTPGMVTMNDVETPENLKRRNRRTAVWLLGWILLLLILSVLVVWFRGQVAMKGL